MQLIKYYCDCCGKEVKNKLELNVIEFYSSFKWTQGEEFPYEYKDICKECKGEIDNAMNMKFEELYKLNNKNNK